MDDFFSSESLKCCDSSSGILIVIPARLASTRLPGKMLAEIGGEPLIVHTWRSVMKASVVTAGAADVVVACDGLEVAKIVEKAGGRIIITDPNLPSGTDRVYAAYRMCDEREKYGFIINVQGDMPFVEAEIVEEAVNLIRYHSQYDISTIATVTNAGREEMYKQEQVVNPVVTFEQSGGITGPEKSKARRVGRALYFSRSPVPFGGPFYKHIGIYGFRSSTLEKFVKFPQSPLEKSEKLEQLRALENGMSMGIKVLDLEYPISVDTAADLEQARSLFKSRGS